MAIIDLLNMPEGALIGLDPGSRTIGVAASDALWLIATPVETIARGKKLGPSLDRLFQIIDNRQIAGLVMGHPLNMNGTPGPRSQSAKALAHNILQKRDLPIAFQDERLSSSQAERVMIEADLSRARRSESIDASAAAIILQTALDRLTNHRNAQTTKGST